MCRICANAAHVLSSLTRNMYLRIYENTTQVSLLRNNEWCTSRSVINKTQAVNACSLQLIIDTDELMRAHYTTQYAQYAYLSQCFESTEDVTQ